VRSSDVQGPPPVDPFQNELRLPNGLIHPDLYIKRKQEALEGKKLPERLRTRAMLFAEIADHATAYLKGRYARPADDVARMKLLKTHFSGPADAITAKEIERVLESLSVKKERSASTRSHHHNLLSLAYRLAILNGHVKDSPLRGLRRTRETDGIVRFLTKDEEKKLREVLWSKPEWAEHEPELDLALNTGLRRGSMYQTWCGRMLIWMLAL